LAAGSKNYRAEADRCELKLPLQAGPGGEDTQKGGSLEPPFNFDIGSSTFRVLSEGGAAVHPNHATSEEVAVNNKLDGKPDFIRRPDAPERNSSDQVSFRFVRDMPEHRSVYQTRGNAARASVASRAGWVA